MAMMRWNPWSDVDTLQGELQKMMDTRAEAGRPWQVKPFQPTVDIYEDGEKYTLKFDLPEVKADDLHIDVENQTLTVSGERKLEKEDKKEGYHRIERSYGSFSRSFTLPNNVNAEKIMATAKDGVLRIELPKKAEAQPRKIAIKPLN